MKVKRYKVRNVRIVIISAFAFILASQFVLFALNTWVFQSVGMDAFTCSDKKEFCGHILFTGDWLGKIDLAGCERTGSISRRTVLLNKFNDSLYLDFGNIASDNVAANQAMLPRLFQGYQPLGLNAINLTKRDLINLDKSGFNDFSATLISANLKIEASNIPKKIIQAYKYVPFKLKNQEESKFITVGITGVTDNLRKLHRPGLKFNVYDVELSLNSIGEALDKADLKILLFNDSFFKLKKLILGGKIDFDLVIAHATLPGQVDKMIRINDTPVVFVEDQGRSVGHVKVLKNKKGFSFEFDAYRLGMGAPEDNLVKGLMEEIKAGMRKNKLADQDSHAHGSDDEANDEK